MLFWFQNRKLLRPFLPLRWQIFGGNMKQGHITGLGVVFGLVAGFALTALFLEIFGYSTPSYAEAKISDYLPDVNEVRGGLVVRLQSYLKESGEPKAVPFFIEGYNIEKDGPFDAVKIQEVPGSTNLVANCYGESATDWSKGDKQVSWSDPRIVKALDLLKQGRALYDSLPPYLTSKKSGKK